MCGKVRYNSRCAAAKGLDTARQSCRRLGQPEPTWPVDIYPCPTIAHHWHLTSDKEARAEHLQRNWLRFELLLAQHAA